MKTVLEAEQKLGEVCCVRNCSGSDTLNEHLCICLSVSVVVLIIYNLPCSLAYETVQDLIGPGSFEKWLYWKTQSAEQVPYLYISGPSFHTCMVTMSH